MSGSRAIPGTFVGPIPKAWVFDCVLPAAAPDASVRRRYIAEARDGVLLAMVSRDGGLWHVSVSHRSGVRDGREVYTRCPTWDEVKHAVYTLVPDDVGMAMYFPKRSDGYANAHATCLHVWEVAPCARGD